MRILSQDGFYDLPYDSVWLRFEENDGCTIYAIPISSVADDLTCDCELPIMGEYSSEAKARKAMEMLHEAYTGIPLILQNVDISDDVKEMFEKWKKQGIFVVSENQPSKVEYAGNILFQFPSDDEVEV